MIFSSQLDCVWGCSALSGVGSSTSDVTSGSSADVFAASSVPEAADQIPASSFEAVFSSQLDCVWGGSTLSGVGGSTSDVTSGSSGIADDISVAGSSVAVSCVSDSVPETADQIAAPPAKAEP